MAKQNKTNQDQEGEISFTMVKFSMKASDAGLQKGIDAIRSAFAQAGIVVPQQDARQLRSNEMKPLAISDQSESAETEVADEVMDAAVADVNEKPMDPRKSSSSRSKPKIKNYTVIEDPGFNTTSPTLKDFAAQKNPTSDAKKFLVIAYCFKHHLKQPDVTNEAFYTAFRSLNWTVPTDIAQNVRELRSARDQRLTKGENPKSSAIALLGEKAVDEMNKAADA